MFTIADRVLEQVSVPTLILDAERCKANIASMYARANHFQLALRPHFKTHQSKAIGERFRHLGVSAITVSSMRMAQYFADDGWDDITVAFPFNTREIDVIDQLPPNVTLNIIVEDPDVIESLNSRLQREVGIFITIDVGAGRTGIHSQDYESIESCLEKSTRATSMSLKGFLTHAGHTYGARSGEEIQQVHESAIAKLSGIYSNYCRNSELIISYGDTPSCSFSESWDYIDEIRPGNFVFYDLMQEQIGSCKRDDIAVCVACPIVSLHQSRNEIVIYGGAIHFGKDSIQFNGENCYGIAYSSDGGSDEIGSVVRLSQEHGVIRIKENTPNLKVGDLVFIYPVHSCMTAQYIGGYVSSTDGEHFDHLAASSLTP